MSIWQRQCSLCDEEKDTWICTGCHNTFCSKHSVEHREQIRKEFAHIENRMNSFRQKLSDQKFDPDKRPLIDLINHWQERSHREIDEKTDEMRNKVVRLTNQSIGQIEKQFQNLIQQFNQIEKEEKYNEIDSIEFNQMLDQLTTQLDQPKALVIKQEETSFLTKLSVLTLADLKWKQKGLTIAGGNGEGNQLNQLYFPHGIVIDENDHVYVADWRNHRIVNVTTNEIVAGGFGQGNRTNQLDRPTDLVLDKNNNCFYIADRDNKRIIRWRGNIGEIFISNINCWGLALDQDGSLYVTDTVRNAVLCYKQGELDGSIVAGGNDKGKQLNQLNFPTYIFVDDDYSIYISDSSNNRIMKWLQNAKQGIVVAGGQGQGHSLKHLSSCQGILVDSLKQIYIADGFNHRVVRWCEDADEGILVVGGNGQGNQANQLLYPRGLAFDRQQNLFVVDQQNHRIQKYELE